MTQKPKRIFICAGEASGDLLGANLAKALLASQPTLQLCGMGDTQMAAAGVHLIQDLSKMGVVGGFEVIKHLKDIYQTAKHVKTYLKTHRPDLLILIDYPGFNLHIARCAKKMGLTVLFYVSPQIWGWRYGRIRRIRRYVDHMAVLYHFEAGIYEKENIPVTFVGHPLAEVAKPSMDQETTYKTLGLTPNHPVVALFPGSRQQEIKRLLPIILEAKKQIQAAMPTVQFALPIASTVDPNTLKPLLPDDITLVIHNTYNLLSIADSAIAASGTATLEIALFKVPLVILYKLAAPTYWALLCMTKTRRIGLCNIIAQEVVAKEFLQYRATADNIANETLQLLTDHSYRHNIQTKMTKVRSGLGEATHSAAKAAAVALDML